MNPEKLAKLKQAQFFFYFASLEMLHNVSIISTTQVIFILCYVLMDDF